MAQQGQIIQVPETKKKITASRSAELNRRWALPPRGHLASCVRTVQIVIRVGLLACSEYRQQRMLIITMWRKIHQNYPEQWETVLYVILLLHDIAFTLTTPKYQLRNYYKLYNLINCAANDTPLFLQARTEMLFPEMPTRWQQGRTLGTRGVLLV